MVGMMQSRKGMGERMNHSQAFLESSSACSGGKLHASTGFQGVNASIPVAVVVCGGRPAVSRGTKTAMSGINDCLKLGFLSRCGP